MAPVVDEMDYNLLSQINEHSKMLLQYRQNWMNYQKVRKLKIKRSNKKKMDEILEKKDVQQVVRQEILKKDNNNTLN